MKKVTTHYSRVRGDGQWIVIQRGKKERWYKYTYERSNRVINATLNMPTEYYPDKIIVHVK